MAGVRLLACYFGFHLMTIGAVFPQELQGSKPDCPELYGICDPFVPGILINQEGKVRDTWPDSPAEKAGICPGDLIIGVDDEPFSIKAVVGSEPSPVRLRVRRDNKDFERVVGRVRESELRSLSGIKETGRHKVPIYQTETLPPILQNKSTSSYPGSWSLIPGDGPEETGDRYFLGIRMLRLAGTGEVIVERIDYPSPAYDAHLQLGDLIISVNGKDTKRMSAEDLRQIFEPSQRKTILFGIASRGGTVNIRITSMKYSQSLSKIGRKLTDCGPIPLHCTCSR